METFDTVAFLTYTIITAFTPGPNNILSMSCTSKYGFKKSKKVLFGIITGFVCVMLLCSLFSISLAAFIPKIMPVMTWIGAAYILWLAWHIYRDEGADSSDDEGTECRFMTGFALQFVNIKIILYGITALTSFVMPVYKSIPVIVLFAVLLALIGAAGNMTWAIFGVVVEKIFSKYRYAFNTSMSLLLVYCAVRLLI